MKMKKVWLMMWVIMLLTVLSGYSQSTVTKLKSIIQPLRLSIGAGKTTNLIFPYSVKSVDRGSKLVLVQKAVGVENILQVKASGDSLKETNLTVITADGSLYSFLLEYAAEPTVFNFNLGLSETTGTPVGILPAGSDNEANIQQVTSKIAAKKPTIWNVKDRQHDLKLELANIFIKDDLLYFQLSLENSSNIRYDIDQLRFFIHDQKRSKRTASQETELAPVQVVGNVKLIEAQSAQAVVFAIPKFTIPDRKFLSVQLMEKNGGRHLKVKISNKLLINCKKI